MTHGRGMLFRQLFVHHSLLYPSHSAAGWAACAMVWIFAFGLCGSHLLKEEVLTMS